MKGINFFEPYKHQAEKKRKKNESFSKWTLIAILFLIFLTEGIFFGINYYKNQEILELENEIYDEIFVAEYNQSQDALKLIEELDLKLKKVEYVIGVMDANFHLFSSDISVLLDNIPEKTYLEKITAVDKTYEIQAITTQYPSVAQYLFNIKSARSDLSGAFVSKIEELDIIEDSKTKDYLYTISINVEEENNEENN